MDEIGMAKQAKLNLNERRIHLLRLNS